MTRRKRTRGHKPKANKLCVSYARVSSKEQYQSGYSLAAQTDLIEAYADENGLKLVERYSDVHSAKAPGRPSFSDMVEFLIRQQYKPSPCRIILVEKTDRLYRNLIDAANLMELDLDIHLIRDNTVISRNDGPSESLVHGLHILISKFHNDNLAADTKKGMYKKVRQGGWPHIGPLGYRNTLGSDGKGAIVPDESRAQHIRELFQMYATGRWTLSSVRNQLVLDGLTTRRGNKPTKSLIHQILTNPIYYGEMFWNGKLWPGKHEPLIEKALFERVQDRLEGKRSSGTGPRKTRWAYQGLVKCGHCGCSMVAEAHKGHTYYHCSGARGRCPEVRWAKEPEIRNAFQEALSLIALDHVHLNWAVQSLRETHKERFSYLKKRGESLEREQERLEQKRKIAYNDRLSGVISQEDYVAIRSEFQTRQSEIQGRLADLRSSGRVYVDDGVRVLELAQKASQLYEKQSPLEGRRLLNILFSNSIWMDQKLQPNFRKPFDVLALLGHEAKKRKGALPKKSALSEKWLRQQDSNL